MGVHFYGFLSKRAIFYPNLHTCANLHKFARGGAVSRGGEIHVLIESVVITGYMGPTRGCKICAKSAFFVFFRFSKHAKCAQNFRRVPPLAPCDHQETRQECGNQEGSFSRGTPEIRANSQKYVGCKFGVCTTFLGIFHVIFKM